MYMEHNFTDYGVLEKHAQNEIMKSSSVTVYNSCKESKIKFIHY